MDLQFFEQNHRMVADEVRRFAKKSITPIADQEDDATERKMVQLLREADLFKYAVPVRLSGTAYRLDVRTLVAAREELAYASGACDSIFAVQGLGSYPIFVGGTDEQRREYLKDAAHGTRIFAFALTEPEAGSDAGALTTTAVRDGSHYVVNGQKRFISNAGIADVYSVFVRTGEGRKGTSALIIHAGTPGFTVKPRTAMLAGHPIAELEFVNCRVPVSHRLGEEGAGLKIAYSTLDVFRASVGAAAVGMGQRALDEGIAYAKKRKQFGAPLASLQGVQFLLADSHVELEAARLLVHQAAATKDGGAERITLEAGRAKMFATEAAQRIIDRCLQIHGGNGVTKGFAVERLYREIRALRIYEGATEVQKLVIASALLA